MVSAIAISRAPVSAARSAIATTRSVGTSPSNGQPNAAPIVAETFNPDSRAFAAMVSNERSEPSMPMFWFRSENVSLATRTTFTSSTPASNARWSPRSLSTRPM